VAPVAVRVGTGMFGSTASADGVKKVVAPVQKCHIPLACMLAETSSAESQELSPHDPLSEAASRPACEVSLWLAPTAGTSGALTSHVVSTTSTG
jgi:hypothetical protein